MSANGNFHTYDNAAVVTKSDTAYNHFRAFFVGVAGDIAFQNKDGTTITLAALPAYTIIPVETIRIMSTGTAATNIIGLS